ncbi:MAG TPA: T9SS type A sorting domain-containing protein [Bacteroidia bacterium]|nr:T9SS type A sorting domain-containing protein [Bacteroidia bacterium]
MQKIRRTFLFISLLIFSGSKSKVAAQSYIPLPDSNAYWLIMAPGGWSTEAFATDTMQNDTLINGVNYTKLFFNPDPQYPPYVFYYVGGYRNDTAAKKTFYIPKDSIQEFLLYDFSVNAGDTIWQVITRIPTLPTIPIQYSIIDLRVDSIRYQTIGPRNHKWVFLYNITNSWYYSSWIELIGSLGGLIDYSQWEGNNLICMNYNDTIYYGGQPPYLYYPGRCDTLNIVTDVQASSSNNTYEIFPSPAADYLSAAFSNIISYPVTVSICNSLGRICKTVVLYHSNADIDVSELSNGIYLIIVENQNNIYKTQKFIKQ